MAMRIEAGTVGRSDLFHIDPAEIVVDEALNGRYRAHDSEAVEELAKSLLEHGQQQPVQVRRLQDNRVQLVLGYRRWKASMHINATMNPEKPFKLQCRVVDANAEEAFLRNVIENHHRRECNPMDYAYQHRRLREDHGWEDKRIAEFYQRSPAWVQQHRDLLHLDGATREKVARGELATNAARDIAQLPEASRQEIIQQATNENGRIDAGAVREAVRAQGGKRARTVKELRVFFDSFTGEDSTEKEQTLARDFLAFIAGELTERQMANRIEKLLS